MKLQSHKLFAVSICMLVLYGISPAISFAETSTVHNLGRLNAAIQELTERGIEFDVPTLEHLLLEALGDSVDSGGRLLSEEEYTMFLQKEKGILYSVELNIVMTNGMPHIAAAPGQLEAKEDGLQAGNILELIDGTDVRGLRVDEIFQLLAGKADTTATLTVRQQDGTELEISMARERIQQASVSVSETLCPEIGYIKFNGIYSGAARDLAPVLENWQTSGVFGVVLDLRGAMGESIEDVCNIASAYTPTGTVIYTVESLNGGVIANYTAKDTVSISMPHMVLINENTSGAAEVLAAALKGITRGSMLLGHESKGDFMLRDPLTIEGGQVLLVSSSILVDAAGNKYKVNHGIRPDISVETSLVSADTPEIENDAPHPVSDRLPGDAALTRAYDLLVGLHALNLKTSEEYKDKEN